MGTVSSVDVRARGTNPAAVEDVIRWLRWVDATFSTYQPRTARSAGWPATEVDVDACAPEVAEILTRCRHLEAEDR